MKIENDILSLANLEKKKKKLYEKQCKIVNTVVNFHEISVPQFSHL